ncbi:Uncharacterised protein [uncultured archaeon]|nr:Uncharacterised protein [uncultured archaeon]
MSLVRMAQAAEAELTWYKKELDEARAVIAQLHRGYGLPGEVTYIHPADFAELLDKAKQHEVVIFNWGASDPTPDMNIVSFGGQRFKQSALMPKITKNLS